MTREEAKELLTDMMMSYVPKDQYGDYGDPEPYEQAYDMAIEALSAEAEWIPCSERLPEKDGSYLVCMSWGYYDMNVYMWADGWNCIRRVNGEIDRQNEIDGADIIAWMPLPKPYREESEVEE